MSDTERSLDLPPLPRGDIVAGLGFSDADPVMECQCGSRFKGDSINDAVLGWTAHLKNCTLWRMAG